MTIIIGLIAVICVALAAAALFIPAVDTAMQSWCPLHGHYRIRSVSRLTCPTCAAKCREIAGAR